MPIQSVCPSCGVRLLIPRKLIGSGRSKSCPKCRALLPIVADKSATVPPNSKSGKPRRKAAGSSRSVPPVNVELMPQQMVYLPATFACPFCKGAILQDAALAGQLVACPHCKGQLVMPAPEPQEVACPYCNTHLPCDPTTAGRVVVCPKCRGQVQMP